MPAAKLRPGLQNQETLLRWTACSIYQETLLRTKQRRQPLRNTSVSFYLVLITVKGKRFSRWLWKGLKPQTASLGWQKWAATEKKTVISPQQCIARTCERGDRSGWFTVADSWVIGLPTAAKSLRFPRRYILVFLLFLSFLLLSLPFVCIFLVAGCVCGYIRLSLSNAAVHHRTILFLWQSGVVF